MGKGIRIFLIVSAVFIGIGVITNVYDTMQKGIEAERLEAERLEAERLEAERLEAERLESLKTPEQKEMERQQEEKKRLEEMEEINRIEEKKRKAQESMQKILDAEKLRAVEKTQRAVEKTQRAVEKPQTCNDYEAGLKGIYDLSNKLNSLCESVQHGSYTDFVRFYSTMQDVEDDLRNEGLSAKQTRDLAWEVVDAAKNKCTDKRTMANTVQLDFALMGLCFESVYEEFGEFPAMELGFP